MKANRVGGYPLDIKRRRLDMDQSDAKHVVPFESETLVNAIGSSELSVVMDELLKLKKYLTTKERVLSLLENDRQCFRTLISFVLNQGSEKFLREADTSSSHIGDQQSNAVLREAFSLLANACHLSVLACVEVRTKDLGLSRLYVRFLEAGQALVPIPLKAALLRLLGNLSELKETATLIALNKPLVERVALCLELEDQKTVDQALRILRLLAKRPPLTKSVIRSEACFHMAKYIARHNDHQQIFRNKPEILQTLNFLIKYHPSNLGRQLANCSDFLDQCLDFLLKFPFNDEREDKNTLEKHWMEFILRSIECSHEMRTVLGRAAISKVLEWEQNIQKLCDLHCRFLCSFTQDVYELTWLRESGGLSKILDRLEPLELDQGKATNEILAQMRIHANIFTSLRFAIYDESLSYIIRYSTFMPTALCHIRHYLDQNAPQCEIEYIEPESAVRLPSALDDQQEQEVSTTDEQHQPLCKDFSSTSPTTFFPHSPSASPHSTRPAWSPSMSPSSSALFSTPSPGASPPIIGGGSSPPGTPSFLLDEILLSTDEGGRHETASPVIRGAAPGELEPDDANPFDETSGRNAPLDEGNDEEGADGAREEMMELRQKIVRTILRLISHFSHQEERQSIFLLKEEILDTLIRHISEAPEMDNQLARALRRLARHQTGLQLLLEMDFHRMVVSRLIRRPCTLARFSRLCVRCDVRRDFGRLLLSDHALLADSPMGEYILLKLRMDAAAHLPPDSQESHFARLKSLMAALVLIRREERRPRFYYNFRPIDALLDGLRRILSESVGIEEERLSDGSKEGQLCCDIVATVASLLSHQLLDSTIQPQPISTQFSRSEEADKTAADAKCALEKTDKSRKCEGLVKEEGEMLKFQNNHGELLAEVPKSKLCAWNEYFSGMFGSEFVERLQCRDRFIFDSEAEACSEQEFVTFLHFSIGCSLQSDCVRVDNAECCAALLYLADKYLCTRLLDHLLAGGVAARFITGQSLSLFLQLVISVPTIADGGGLKDICMLVLLRYSNNAQLLSTLRHIAKCDSGTGRTIDGFIMLLNEFIASYTGIRNAAIPWQFDPNPNSQYRDF